MFNKQNKQQTSSFGSSAAPEITITVCSSRTMDKKKSFFEERWEIDDEGFVTLKDDDNTSIIINLKNLLDDVIRGYTVEEFRDNSGHKRYRRHRSHSVSGLNYRGERFGFFFSENADDYDSLVDICHLSDSGYDWLDDIDLFDYTAYVGFVPVIDTRFLSCDIKSIMDNAISND